LEASAALLSAATSDKFAAAYVALYTPATILRVRPGGCGEEHVI
jgi:hypothetical protein